MNSDINKMSFSSLSEWKTSSAEECGGKLIDPHFIPSDWVKKFQGSGIPNTLGQLK